MKASLSTIFFLACTALASTEEDAASLDQRYARARTLCGELGIMPVPAEYEDRAAEVRLCADHPVYHDGKEPDSNPKGTFPTAPEKQACYTETYYGCSHGYCWKACGDLDRGEWCWTAADGGLGKRATCKTTTDCGIDNVNFGCPPDSCGCKA